MFIRIAHLLDDGRLHRDSNCPARLIINPKQKGQIEMKKWKNQGKRRLRQILFGPFPILITAAALLIIPINTSIGCGEGEWGGWYDDWFWEPGIDVTDELVVDEGWSLKALPAVQAQSVEDSSVPIKSTNFKGNSRDSVRSNKRSIGGTLQLAAPTYEYTQVKTLTISGPWGTEVSIDRSLNGVDWEVADVIFIDDEDSVLWTEILCNDDCENYQYRCTGYLWDF